MGYMDPTQFKVSRESITKKVDNNLVYCVSPCNTKQIIIYLLNLLRKFSGYVTGPLSNENHFIVKLVNMDHYF